MKRLLLISAAIIMGLYTYPQVKDSTTNKSKLLTPVGATLSLSQLEHGKYLMSYLNGIGKSEFRSIIFINKKEAKTFISVIAKSIKAKDGVSSQVIYSNYRIRLLTEMGGVFMIVDEKDKSQSTFRITKENFDQIDILK
jgi:hypothetical protein